MPDALSTDARRPPGPLKFSEASADMLGGANEPQHAGTDMTPEQVTEAEILTVHEVARFLRVPKSTVYKLARVGQIPASKIGKHWRFTRSDIQSWMHDRSRH